MTDTTLLNALSPRPSSQAKSESGSLRESKSDPFSNVLNTVRNDKPARQVGVRNENQPPSKAREAVTKETAAAPEAKQTPPASDGEDRAVAESGPKHAANDPEPAVTLTDEQRQAFESLPEEQQAALNALTPKRMAEVLQMMMAQQQKFSSATPEIDAILADLSQADLERLQGVLNDLARVFNSAESMEQVISKAQQIIDEQLGETALADLLTQQLGDIAATSMPDKDSSTIEALAHWLAGAQLVVAQKSDRTTTAHNLTNTHLGTVDAGSTAEYVKTPETLVKLTATEQGPDGLDLSLESGKLLESVKASEQGKFAEIAKLHNLFSARGNDEAAASTTNVPAMLSAAQKLSASSEQAPVLQSQLGTRFGTGAWGDAVGQKVLWMARQNITSAELRLDPPDLGPVQVRVSVQNDQAHITFSSQQPVVREALDQNAFRLREMLAEQGMTQVDVNVSEQGQQQGDERGASGSSGTGAVAADESDSSSDTRKSADSVVRLIDQYA
ncbi:flagellar hook-length control protein FliK [Gilvimarinus sp. DA14]|uniref:flagellar hook-length control protein FliK n=1 Tax=Gilvimarinus sp. DA14 TaxID=2956798 RepID=UPI0020B6F7C8|nr:flagellar hook-length control protein FliK [Gilvimarinus sp. DA14]UTF60788.1 flagellar hook-length control protein FliK [Gilvimarinus sp. DA14]